MNDKWTMKAAEALKEFCFAAQADPFRVLDQLRGVEISDEDAGKIRDCLRVLND